LSVTRVFPRDPRPGVGAIALKKPHFDVISEEWIQNFGADSVFQLFIFNREQDFDSSIEISVHDVGTAEVNARRVAGTNI